jgi:glycyl-tRNA synthetase
VQSQLQGQFRVEYDQTGGHIGRRYRRQDEIGTPFCITVDFETLNDKAVTIRHRDTTKQDRVAIAELTSRLQKLI